MIISVVICLFNWKNESRHVSGWSYRISNYFFFFKLKIKKKKSHWHEGSTWQQTFTKVPNQLHGATGSDSVTSLGTAVRREGSTSHWFIPCFFYSSSFPGPQLPHPLHLRPHTLPLTGPEECGGRSTGSFQFPRFYFYLRWWFALNGPVWDYAIVEINIYNLNYYYKNILLIPIYYCCNNANLE